MMGARSDDTFVISVLIVVAAVSLVFSLFLVWLFK